MGLSSLRGVDYICKHSCKNSFTDGMENLCTLWHANYNSKVVDIYLFIFGYVCTCRWMSVHSHMWGPKDGLW